jgi:hypothetical protein
VKRREEELKRNGFSIKDSQVFDRKLMIKKMKEEKEKQIEREIEKQKQIEREREKQKQNEVKVNKEIINENKKKEINSDSYDTDSLLNDLELEDDTISIPSSISKSSETSNYEYYSENSY